MNKFNVFPDLTDYSYGIAPYILKGVKNVGWIDVESEFSTGDMPISTFNKLKSLVDGAGCVKPLVEPLREFPVCELCGEIKLFGSSGRLIPDSGLWIPGREVVYASPVMILHYIEVHGYLPPVEYISAIDALDENIPFVADDLYRERLWHSEWGKLSAEEKMDIARVNSERMSGGKSN
ncbi:hypothetical protein [Pseudomonas sp. COR18]|uniref:DUF7919 family protein n=1 Tax=Pseudomonas sp. COR18 TaxID=3399680 RepID=UPI003B00DBA2